MIPLAAAAAAVPLSPAAAQAAAPVDATGKIAVSDSTDSVGGAAEAPPVPGDAAQAHPDTDQEIVITGVKRPAGDILGGVSVVDQEVLQHDARPSLGETLASQPGLLRDPQYSRSSNPFWTSMTTRAALVSSVTVAS